jgi:hypothetical protein
MQLSQFVICLALSFPLVVQLHLDEHPGQQTDDSCVICFAKTTLTSYIAADSYQFVIACLDESPFSKIQPLISTASFQYKARSPPSN